MGVPFKGKINVDIRDSVPDWSPFEPPRAPEGAPNVSYAVLDDVGFSAMRCYGGPVETPNIDRIAGFLAHTDAQIGRLLDYLEEAGQRENTMVILVSDNGASGEGGPNGSVNECKMINGIPDDMAENLTMLDELGGPMTYNHYPNGWAMAFNTPFKMWKRYEFNGGTTDPCIISWPQGIKAQGELRDQYHHAVDLVPTILDALGVEPPEAIGGHVQSRFDVDLEREAVAMMSRE